jgi:UDP-N-acetylglucosamine diphosphorylase / glucose-1-phosphate thymidylyltransferase / UDP-N-acetylgalactosamine diphosphorylase / glucosamine-1-phosphate N-acetyltransferase / galactosamine-1-phosphate N-acetyltransferase
VKGKIFDDVRALVADYDIYAADEQSFSRAHTFVDELPVRLAEALGDLGQLIAEDAKVHPTSIIGPNVVVFPGATVGPYCYVRSSTVLLPGAYLGYMVEVNASVLFERVQVHHSAVICQSIIGTDSNLAFGFATTTKKITGRRVRYCDGNGGLTESAATHHGSVLGSFVATGAHVAVMPGSSICPRTALRPQTCVQGFVRAGGDG